MNMYDQTVQFEKTALSIFHEIKTYLPAKVILDYLQEKHSEYLKQQNITNARNSDGEGGAGLENVSIPGEKKLSITDMDGNEETEDEDLNESGKST